MLIFSHRGYHAVHHENTLAAFETALELGVDGIETDIRKTRDNRLVLFHDRLSPLGRPLSELTHAQLMFECGYTVPTLADALALSQATTWNLEIKHPDSLKAFIQIIENLGRLENILVTSFFHDVVTAVAHRLEVPCGILIAHRPLNLDSLLQPLQSAHPEINRLVLPVEFVDPELVSAARRNGFEVMVYDVENRQDFMRCQHSGAVGIITNQPPLFLPDNRNRRSE